LETERPAAETQAGNRPFRGKASGFKLNKKTMPVESALVVLIPEVESLVENFRLRYDPSAAIGMPAHITILYPFIAPDKLTTDITTTLRELFSKLPSFTISFPEAQRFPDVLYLAPVPSEPFRQLTGIIAGFFPDTPPYGGAFAENIPHLTVAQVGNLQQLDEITTDFHEAAKDKLPIYVRVNTVSLVDNSGGYWQIRAQFSLRPDKQDS
jgi:2'-5' RNA ligase